MNIEEKIASNGINEIKITKAARKKIMNNRIFCDFLSILKKISNGPSLVAPGNLLRLEIHATAPGVH